MKLPSEEEEEVDIVLMKILLEHRTEEAEEEDL